MAFIENTIGNTNSGGISNQDNIDRFLTIRVLDSEGITSNTIDEINALGYIIDETESLWIQFYRQETIDVFGIINKIDIYKVINTGKGLLVIDENASNLKYITSYNPSTIDYENLESTDIITITSLGGLRISEYVNQHVPPYIIQDQSEGYTIFQIGTDPDNLTSYLYLGEGGSYGQGSGQTTDADFQLLSNTTPQVDYIPLSGTEEGSPVTGDIEISNNPGEKSIFSKSGDDLIKLAFDIEDDQFYLERYKSGKSNRLHFTEGYLLVENTSDIAKGIIGIEEFNKQGDRKAYAQISDIVSVLSNDITKAKIEGDFIYGILDQYTGEEITLSKIDLIPTGNSVDNIIYFQLESELFKRVFTIYNIQWFGAKPDGSDCTEAIQACINSCFYAGGGTILTPHGVYDIAGPLITSDNKGNNPNSQLYIPGKRDVAFPDSSGTDTIVSIKFIGSETATMNASGFTDDKINLITDGCYWKSTLPYSTTSGVLPSVIGTKGDNPTYNFNIIDVVFEDMWIRTHHDSIVGTYMTAFNMLDAAFSTFNRCRADIDVSGWNTVTHQNQSIGIAPTKSNGGTTVVATNCTSYGYQIGYTVGEHSYYENLNANFCNYAYDISKAGHGSLITRCLAQWNKVILSFNKYDNGYPTAFNFIDINELVVENVALGKWYDSVLDVDDPTNGIQGNCFYTKTVSGAGVFPTTLLTKNGGTKLNDKHITLPIVVVESDVEIKKITIKNNLPTSPFAYSAIDFFGGGSIDNSSKFQLGQFSEGTAFFFNVGNKPIDFYTNSLKRLSLNADGTATFASTVQIANATASNHAVALGQVQTEITVISDTTVALAVPNLYKWYSLTGSGTLASLPPIAGNVGKTITIANKSGSIQNLYSNDGTSNEIWSNGVAVNTVAMPIGFVGELFLDGIHWVVK